MRAPVGRREDGDFRRNRPNKKKRTENDHHTPIAVLFPHPSYWLPSLP